MSALSSSSADTFTLLVPQWLLELQYCNYVLLLLVYSRVLFVDIMASADTDIPAENDRNSIPVSKVCLSCILHVQTIVSVTGMASGMLQPDPAMPSDSLSKSVALLGDWIIS